jgi:hypothetical protein
MSFVTTSPLVAIIHFKLSSEQLSNTPKKESMQQIVIRLFLLVAIRKKESCVACYRRKVGAHCVLVLQFHAAISGREHENLLYSVVSSHYSSDLLVRKCFIFLCKDTLLSRKRCI